MRVFRQGPDLQPGGGCGDGVLPRPGDRADERGDEVIAELTRERGQARGQWHGCGSMRSLYLDPVTP